MKNGSQGNEKNVFYNTNATIKKDYLTEFYNLEKLDRWQVSSYEKDFLPNMKHAGYGTREHVILQNIADVHVHTHWSDGDKLERVLEAAIEFGLDAVAITDHDEIGGALEARRIVHERKLPIAVIPGIEVSSRDGHIGGLFVTKKIPPKLSASETVKLIHKAGGIAVAHHPYTPRILELIFRENFGVREQMHTVPFDAIECYNGVPGSGVRYNLKTIHAVQNHKTKIAITGGSDAHFAQFVGKGLTYYPGNQGVLSLYYGLLNGLTHGSAGYWTFNEKVIYYHHLAISAFTQFFKRYFNLKNT